MPLQLRVPLPGPFVYSKQLGGGKGGGQLLYWVLIAWWWLPVKWSMIGLYYFGVACCKLAVWSARGTTNYVRAVDDLHRQRR